ncbi:MAG: AAA family ATPase, partial [Spongiibacteraceae bacterium]
MSGKIITIVNRKGGAGKTTVATNLAACAAAQGKSVILADTDPQGSSFIWSEERSEKEGLPFIACAQVKGKSLARQLIDFKEKYDLVIVDSGGSDSPEMRASMAVADLALVPVRPSSVDAWSIEAMAEYIEELRDTFGIDLQAKIFVNAASSNTLVRDTAELKEYFQNFGETFGICKAVLRDRQIFRRALGDG